MGEELPQVDACMVVFDGFLNSEEGRVEALIGGVASLKRQLMAEIALPYREASDDAGSRSPIRSTVSRASDDQPEMATSVDPTEFDSLPQWL
jgi:hypothetical protein